MSSLAERFWAKVDMRGPDECWPWTAHIRADGYGQFWDGRQNTVAQRIAFALTYGPVPANMTVDHACHSRDLGCAGGVCAHRRCVNPGHLEAMTNAENVARGRQGARQRARTHCPHGHPYSGANLYVRPDGDRVCRECARASWRAYHARRTA